MIRPVRDADDHRRAVARIEEIFDAAPGSPEADELDVLTTLVSQFEKEHIRAPSPLEAIRFRLQQAGLTSKALEPYLGSRSRVSEVMSGERKLTVDMMRSLHLHFGIPAEALLGGGRNDAPPGMMKPRKAPEPSARTLAELIATGTMRAKESYADFLARACSHFPTGIGLRQAHLRKTRTERTNAKTDTMALEGWCAAALIKSLDLKVAGRPPACGLGMDLGREIAGYSSRSNGISEVGELLSRHGIALTVLRHFAGTYLDGAAMRRSDGVYVIALTLRYDRIDNFWFTLLHEFAHVACHLDDDTSMIFDDLEIGSTDRVEEEADRFAQEALIPERFWTRANADFGSLEVADVARNAGVHPAIVAGRWQREFKDYRRFSKLVGHGEVRSALLQD